MHQATPEINSQSVGDRDRFLREAKVLQIVEGTNQIQRMVIARALRRG